MAGQRVTRVVCAADARASGDAVERLLEAAVERNAHAVSLVGDLSDGHGSPEGYPSRLPGARRGRVLIDVSAVRA